MAGLHQSFILTMRVLKVYSLIFLVLAPSLLCAKPFCPAGSLQTEPMDLDGSGSHCGESAEQIDQQRLISSMMLMADCSDIELAPASSQVTEGKSCKLVPELFTAATINVALDADRYEHAIRGSPRLAMTANVQPVYLATQRLRI